MLFIHCYDIAFSGEPGQFVLALHDNQWLRGEVCAANAAKAVVGCMDIGNIALLDHKDVIPLPRQFSHLPMLACKINLSGCKDTDDVDMNARAVALLQVIGDFYHMDDLLLALLKIFQVCLFPGER